MKKIFLNTKIFLSSIGLLQKLRRCVSPIFLMMLVASFVLWYIAKLSYTYTTELDVVVSIENQSLDVRCVVEGVGSNLFGYKISGRKANVKIPVSELRYEVLRGGDTIQLFENSLSGAMSIRFSDIKIISIDTETLLPLTPELREAIYKSERR